MYHLNEIKKLIPQNFSKLKNIFKLILYSKFFLNFFKQKSNAIKFSNKFYETWSKEIIKDKSLKKNWRQKYEAGLVKNIDSHFSKTNFDALKKIFLYLSERYDSILDIGSYDGYFIQYYQSFKNIYLSDITDHSKIANYSFYKLNGQNLDIIPDNKVDVVFSIDTFVRLSPDILEKYFLSFKRIIKKDGILICHIPDMYTAESYKKNFTMVDKKFYKNLLEDDFNLIFDNNISMISSFLIGQKK